MSSLTTLARPYAKAAFELAHKGGNLSAWDEQLSVSVVGVDNQATTLWLQSPGADSSQVVQLINDVVAETTGSDADGQFLDYLAVLAANDRLSLLAEITRLYRRLRLEAEKRLPVQVVSAIALDDDQVTRMRNALARRFECEIELNNEVDASVLGGAIIYAGDQVIDGSLTGRLDRLRNALA